MGFIVVKARGAIVFFLCGFMLIRGESLLLFITDVAQVLLLDIRDGISGLAQLAAQAYTPSVKSAILLDGNCVSGSIAQARPVRIDILVHGLDLVGEVSDLELGLLQSLRGEVLVVNLLLLPLLLRGRGGVGLSALIDARLILQANLLVF